MKSAVFINGWNAYRKYVRSVLLPAIDADLKGIAYWRNEIFCNILTYLTPLSLIALVPSVYMAFANGLPAVGVTDLLAFSIVVFIMTNRWLPLSWRKFIFIFIFYIISIVLLYYVSVLGPGLLFLLALTVLTSVIYSSSAAYYSAWSNTIICLLFAVFIYLSSGFQSLSGYRLGAWVAVSSNLILLSFVCAYCLNLLLKGLETSIKRRRVFEANLTAIIQNTDSSIYSLDRSLRYITFNNVLKKNIKQMYNVDIKPGDRVLDFLEGMDSEEAHVWENVYAKALKGELVKFEKEFKTEKYHTIISFSINPIIENSSIIGLACFAADVTDSKLAELERIKITDDLIQRNKDLEQFSYIVSHNLRAPVANIIGLSAAVQSKDLDPALRDEMMNGLSQSSGNLDEVIIDLNDILQTKRDVSQKKEIVCFSKIANDICSSIEHMIESKKAVIVFDFSEVDEILTLKSYLHSIFYNLISNSLKYHRLNVPPAIEIKSRKLNDKIELTFTDNGLGIDLERKGDKVFGLYKRFHANVAEGKGMGLYMVKTQVESIGGKISIESRVNAGTTFKIEFNT